MRLAVYAAWEVARYRTWSIWSGCALIAGARDEVADLRLKVRAGIDPLDKRKKAELAAATAELEEKNARATFRTVAAAYITANFDSWRHDEAGQEGRIAAS